MKSKVHKKYKDAFLNASFDLQHERYFNRFKYILDLTASII